MTGCTGARAVAAGIAEHGAQCILRPTAEITDPAQSAGTQRRAPRRLVAWHGEIKEGEPVLKQ
jgi:hypothetical protein